MFLGFEEVFPDGNVNRLREMLYRAWFAGNISINEARTISACVDLTSKLPLIEGSSIVEDGGSISSIIALLQVNS